MDNKKKLIFLGLDVLVLIVTIGVSLAVFNYVKKGENPNRVTAGAITMNFTEGVRNISLPVATPTSDEEGRSFGLDGSTCQNDSENNIQCYTDFTVSTNMSINYNIGYEVTLEKDEETTLNNDDVRIYLEKQDSEGNYKEVFTPKVYTEIDSENLTETDELGATNSEMLLDSGEITKSTTYNYRLRIWLSSDYTFTNETKDFVGKINVYGSNVEVNASTGITLDKTTLTMQKGTTNTLTATIKPDNAKNKNLIWESSNPNVVKVDSVGNITAVEVGTSIITVRTSDRSYSATSTITVVNYDAKGVTLNTKEVTLSKGNTYQLTSTVTPTDAEDTRVTYTSSSEGIATISSSGLITAVGVGETVITATTENGITATCKVIVTEPNVATIAINGNDSVDVGNVITLTTSITTTSGTTPTDIVWTSSDESKATITSGGKVTGIEPGQVTITAYVKSQPDLTATKEIVVQYPEIETITMSSDMTINYGNTTTFSIWISPNQVRNQDKIRWTSSNPSVTTIPSSCNGNLSCSPTIISDGTSTIKAVVVDSEGNETSIFDTSTLTVKINTVNLASYIESLWKKEGGVTASTIAYTTILFSDSTSDNNIRYTGRNANNYVNFNGELWRIVGVMNNIYSNGNAATGVGIGTVETRVKIMKAESIEKLSWDSSASDVNSGYGVNDWANADLKNELNGIYYNKSSGTCYNGMNNHFKTCDFTGTDVLSKGLEADARLMIDDAWWYLGASDKYSETNLLTHYVAERGSTKSSAGGALGWSGKVGLIYPSDYGFAAYYCTKNRPFFNGSSGSSEPSDYSACNWYNWMFNGSVFGSLPSSAGGSNEWTLSPWTSNTNVWNLSVNGDFHWDIAFAVYSIRPSLYLKSNVVVKQDGADGSYDKPYNIALDS